MTSHDSTLRQVDSGGVGLKGHFSMWGYLTQAPNQTSKPHCPLLIDVTRWRRSGRTNNEFARWNTQLSLPFTPLVLSSTGGMGKAATTFYKRLSSMLSEREMCPAVRWLDGYGVGWALPCFEHRSCRSEAQGHLSTDQSYLSLSRFKLLRDTFENLILL